MNSNLYAVKERNVRIDSMVPTTVDSFIHHRETFIRTITMKVLKEKKNTWKLRYGGQKVTKAETWYQFSKRKTVYKYNYSTY